MDKTYAARTAAITRGALAKRSGCHIETIRYYEKIALMPPPARSAGGHRLYDSDGERRLNFICRARELGFTLEDIRTLLGLVDGGDLTCAEAKALTLDQAARIRAKVADLKRIERILTGMAARCDEGNVPSCPVIDALFDPANGAPPPG